MICFHIFQLLSEALAWKIYIEMEKWPLGSRKLSFIIRSYFIRLGENKKQVTNYYRGECVAIDNARRHKQHRELNQSSQLK